jgi:hypothetical protein
MLIVISVSLPSFFITRIVPSFPAAVKTFEGCCRSIPANRSTPPVAIRFEKDSVSACETLADRIGTRLSKPRGIFPGGARCRSIQTNRPAPPLDKARQVWYSEENERAPRAPKFRRNER